MCEVTIRLVDRNGDEFVHDGFTPGSRLPGTLLGVDVCKHGMPTVLIVRYLHEMTNAENEEWVNARVRDAREWFARKREEFRQVGRTWPRERKEPRDVT